MKATGETYLTEKRILNIFSGMMRRCFNSDDASFNNYGGRGIIVCEEWKNDRKDFLLWAINNGYQSDLQIDRINNDGNYEPENCRWVTAKVNCRNTRRTRYVDVNGKKKALLDVSEDLGMAPNKLLKTMEEKEIVDLRVTEMSKRIIEMAERRRTNTKAYRMAEMKVIIDDYYTFFQLK